ncbi:6-hydroxymethylpterin diphosphokinase MptE-like protein [Natronococcus occultus]|uniref:6-hydroxymethyl-7,8-dihydropterin pyrophosphokinase n=1 Tax=Natronococcus occultus SP4 TaxID=694430 RepID=L0JYZ7_9EURY|nr:6-hydroxymethylpterin diphosphokinase MptE-like protein [Natronococcus occultus]AGB37530.1 putative Rossmann fold enzyme [Natronococcus occultus SP4]
MEFDEWEPVYDAIRREFGYDRHGDERARDVLAELTDPFDLRRLDAASGATVAVVGAGPTLSDELAVAREADVVFAASTAADTLLEADIDVDCMVTDLDKNPDTVRRLTRQETPVAVHAHGDNISQLRAVVPNCRDDWLLPTTQVAPRGPVRNVGGFTDGDRAAFLADRLGAGELRFVGWLFDDPSVDPTKARKLVWAERLLYWLETRRDERFDVLDGRRSTIETVSLPVD